MLIFSRNSKNEITTTQIGEELTTITDTATDKPSFGSKLEIQLRKCKERKNPDNANKR